MKLSTNQLKRNISLSRIKTLIVIKNGMKFLIKNGNGQIFGIFHLNAYYPIRLKTCNGKYRIGLYIQKKILHKMNKSNDKCNFFYRTCRKYRTFVLRLHMCKVKRSFITCICNDECCRTKRKNHVEFTISKFNDEGSVPEMRIWSILLIKSD